MIKWKKEEKAIFVVLLVLSIIIPILIHILYKVDVASDFLSSTWSSGDILQYSGTILAALLAIASVYFTIKETRSSNLENKIIENKPYLKTNFIQLLSFQEKKTLQENNNIVCIWDLNGTKCFNLANIQGKRDLSSYHDEYDIRDDFIFELVIQNIGLGNAMNLEVKICDLKFFPKTIICKGEELDLYVIINKDLVKNGLALDLQYEYKDILDVNIYEQHERAVVSYNKKEKRYIYTRDFEDEISEPHIIEKRLFV